MKKQNDKSSTAAAAENAAPAGRELNLKTVDKIGPPKAEPVKDGKHPTLAERIAKEPPSRPPLRAPRTAKPAAPGKQPRFSSEEGHPLEHVGNMGKLSKVTRAVPDEPDYFAEPKEPLPTLDQRFRQEGMAAYGVRGGGAKPKPSPKA